MNFGAMIGEVAFWNPNQLAKIPVLLNNSLRKVIDRRTWYGLYTKGQLICPQAYTTGTATVTLNSETVQGNGTSWDQSMIGRQFRQGVQTSPYTITGVDPFAQTLTLELPWGGPMPPNTTSMTGGYYIVQMYYNFGPNIKYIKQVVNMQMGFKFRLNLTQDFLDNIDPWRITTNFPWGAAPLPPDQNGNYLVELWPGPWTQQQLPFMTYTQPANLVSDNDSLPPYIRCDVVVKDAISKVVLLDPRNNPAVSNNASLALQISNRFAGEFESDMRDMANADENLYRTSATIPGEDLPYYTPGGATYQAMHAIMAEEVQGW